MAVEAVVREWRDEEGWGMLDSASTPGGCFVLFSAIAAAGYRRLTPGQAVHLEYESGQQDGYQYRAVRVWPTGTEPAEPPISPPGGAYSSTLTLTFDDER